MTWQENFDTNFNKIASNTQNQFNTGTLSAFQTCFWHVRITCYILKSLCKLINLTQHEKLSFPTWLPRIWN